MTTKYIGTMVGFGFMLPGLLSAICDEMMFFSIISILSYLPIALPLELMGQAIFDQYSSAALFVFLGLSAAFGFSSFYFFKNLVKDRDASQPLNMVRFWGYFGLQLLIIHPVVFYIWAFINSANSGDGQFIMGAFETFPISSMLFLVIGFTIDFLKNQTNE
jgi:hypothetical protein